MKKIFLLLSMALVAVLDAFAQDIITKRDGEEIQAKVLSVNTDIIEYKKWSNLEGPVYSIAVSEVFMIKYQNGEKDVLPQAKQKAEEKTSQPTYGNLYAPRTQMQSFNNCEWLIKQAERKEKASKMCWGFGVPVGVVIGVGGALLIDSWMIWVGLGSEVIVCTAGACLERSAGKLREKAALYTFDERDFKIGKTKFNATCGLINDGSVGLLINF